MPGRSLREDSLASGTLKGETARWIKPVPTSASAPVFPRVGMCEFPKSDPLHAMTRNFTTFAFSDTTRALQERYGSRASYARMENSGDRFILGDGEIEFIGQRDGFYLSTVGTNGWPYVQFRGGPPGFLKVLDAQTIGYADFRGNKQFISMGNIRETGHASLILMDYPRQQRLKIWAEARMVFLEDEPDLVERLTVPGYNAKVERGVILSIQAYDWNCPQHIPQRFTLQEILGSPALRGRLKELIDAREALESGGATAD